MPPTQRNLIPAVVQSGRVIDVDSTNFKMTVRTEVGERTLFNLPVPGVILHEDGSGILYMPEVGDSCWVCIPSEADARPFAMLGRPLSDEVASFRSKRASLLPGDVSISTKDGNLLKVARGGMVEISSTPIAKTVWAPLDNSILDICENRRMLTFGGELSWVSRRPEESPDGSINTTFGLHVKEKAEDQSPVVRLQLGGSVPGANSPVLNLQVFSDGDTDEAGLDQVLSLRMNKDGQVYLDSSTVRINLAAGTHVSVFEDEANVEGVILGKTFLVGELAAWTDVQTVMTALGFTMPNIPQHITRLTTSVASPTGSAPYLSTKLKTE